MTRTTADLPKLSRLLWDLDWSRHLPAVLGDTGVTAVLADVDAATRFHAAHGARIFEFAPDDRRFLAPGPSPARSRYLAHACDVFALVDGDRTIGMLVCSPVDQDAYYVRSGAVLPEYQDRGVMRAALEHVIGVVGGHGVKCAEIETSPANHRVHHLLARMGFVHVGHRLSERFGAMLRLARFLDPDHEHVFRERYCAGGPAMGGPRRGTDTA